MWDCKHEEDKKDGWSLLRALVGFVPSQFHVCEDEVMISGRDLPEIVVQGGYGVIDWSVYTDSLKNSKAHIFPPLGRWEFLVFESVPSRCLALAAAAPW